MPQRNQRKRDDRRHFHQLFCQLRSTQNRAYKDVLSEDLGHFDNRLRNGREPVEELKHVLQLFHRKDPSQYPHQASTSRKLKTPKSCRFRSGPGVSTRILTRDPGRRNKFDGNLVLPDTTDTRKVPMQPTEDNRAKDSRSLVEIMSRFQRASRAERNCNQRHRLCTTSPFKTNGEQTPQDSSPPQRRKC